MYFIKTGVLQVVSPDGTKVFANLKAGAAFGEIRLDFFWYFNLLEIFYSFVLLLNLDFSSMIPFLMFIYS